MSLEGPPAPIITRLGTGAGDRFAGQIEAKHIAQNTGAECTGVSTLAEQIEARFKALERIRLSEMASLIRRGVSALSLVTPELPARARVAFGYDRPWFDFADEVDDDRQIETVLIFLARDEYGEVVDLIAWAPASSRVGAWFGCAPALGLEALSLPRIDHNGALPVFFDPWRWLAAGRDGLVLIDPIKAAPILRDAGPLLAENVDAGVQLLEIAQAKPPRVLVPKEALEAVDE